MCYPSPSSWPVSAAPPSAGRGGGIAAGATAHSLILEVQYMLRTLFLQAPSFEGFDGGAGSRWQAKREVKSFWYPTWLAQPAALVEGSRLIDAPPHRQSLADVLPLAKDYDLVVLHTSTPSFSSDVKTIEAMKSMNPDLKAGL